MKETYIRIRCTAEEKEQIKKNAERNNVTMTTYILALAVSKRRDNK